MLGRRVFSGAVLGGLLLAGLAGPTFAASPQHFKTGPYTATFPAGVVCTFAVEWDITAKSDNVLIFPVRANGDQLQRSTGHSQITVTNLDAGRSVNLQGGFRQDLVFHADGTIDADLSGTISAGYFPTDVGGPSMWWFKGHLHDTIDSTFSAITHVFVGNATDLCAALA